MVREKKGASQEYNILIRHKVYEDLKMLVLKLMTFFNVLAKTKIVIMF